MRYNNILQNQRFKILINELTDLEKERRFCKHGIEHLLDVARAAYIIKLENGLDIDKDLIYAAALLHDIGRCEEYKTGVEHHIAGVAIAKEILSEVGVYTDEETDIITEAISSHRKQTDILDLSGIIYMADKLVRPCLMCDALGECNWSENKKNYIMRY
jgi:uncharacterized protein